VTGRVGTAQNITQWTFVVYNHHHHHHHHHQFNTHECSMNNENKTQQNTK